MAPVAVGRSVPGTGSWNEWCRDSSVRRVGCVVHAVGLEVAAQRDMDGVFLIVLKKLGQVGWWCFGCVAVWWGDVGWVIGPSVLLRGSAARRFFVVLHGANDWTFSTCCAILVIQRVPTPRLPVSRAPFCLSGTTSFQEQPKESADGSRLTAEKATQQRKKRDAHQDSHSTAGWTGPGSNQSDEANLL
ncbi:hypothetical protein BKA80DRAFT_255323 [Phyllosticta citrichinensis]